MKWTLFASLFALVNVATAHPQPLVHSEPTALESRALTQDDLNFFRGPYDLSGVANGAVLNSRKISQAGLQVNVTLSGAYQIVYKSYNPVTGNDYATPATIYVPANNKAASAAGNGINRILIRAVSYDSATNTCGPSYSTTNDPKTGPDFASVALINKELAAGFTVVMPDWEGPRALFLVGPANGNAILDAARAALNFGTITPDRSAVNMILYGYSGAATAVAWAAQQQPTYAPELVSTIKGAAIGGLPGNVTADLIKLDGGAFSGLTVVAVASLIRAYPALQTFLDSIINPAGTAAIAYAQSNCLFDVINKYPNKKFFESFTNLTLAQATRTPAIRNVLDQLQIGLPGTPLPQIPLYSWSLANDDSVPYSDSANWYNSLCKRGIRSFKGLTVLSPLSTHVFAAQGSTYDRALDFMKSMANGTAPIKGCQSSTYFTLAL